MAPTRYLLVFIGLKPKAEAMADRPHMPTLVSVCRKKPAGLGSRVGTDEIHGALWIAQTATLPDGNPVHGGERVNKTSRARREHLGSPSHYSFSYETWQNDIS